MLKVITNIRKIGTVKLIPTRISAEGKDVPKKKTIENRITLIGTDNTLTITELRNAQNLSTRRDLKLVKIEDDGSKTRRPIYKLMTNAQYHEEELQRRKEKQVSKDVTKGDKLLTLSTKIAHHDLMTRIKKIGKLLDKNNEVRVIITNADDNEECKKAEEIYTVIEDNLKLCGRIVQKRIKGNTLRFQVLPPKDNREGGTYSNSSQENNNKGPL